MTVGGPAAPLDVLALGDALAAAADDLGIVLGSRDVRRLAPHVVEVLELGGWRLTRHGLDGDERIEP